MGTIGRFRFEGICRFWCHQDFAVGSASLKLSWVQSIFAWQIRCFSWSPFRGSHQNSLKDKVCNIGVTRVVKGLELLEHELQWFR